MNNESVIHTKKLINETTERNFTVSILIHGSGGSRPSDKGGAGHPDSEIRGGGGFKKFFSQFGLKLRGTPSSGSATACLLKTERRQQLRQSTA